MLYQSFGGCLLSGTLQGEGAVRLSVGNVTDREGVGVSQTLSPSSSLGSTSRMDPCCWEST